MSLMLGFLTYKAPEFIRRFSQGEYTNFIQGHGSYNSKAEMSILVK